MALSPFCHPRLSHSTLTTFTLPCSRGCPSPPSTLTSPTLVYIQSFFPAFHYFRSNITHQKLSADLHCHLARESKKKISAIPHCHLSKTIAHPLHMPILPYHHCLNYYLHSSLTSCTRTLYRPMLLCHLCYLHSLSLAADLKTCHTNSSFLTALSSGSQI